MVVVWEINNKMSSVRLSKYLRVSPDAMANSGGKKINLSFLIDRGNLLFTVHPLV